MSQSQSSLRFSLEEAVWFKKGQEVEELLSISLDPHITIQEQEQYVQIQGSLQLSGDYKSNGDLDQEQALDLQGKFAQRVEYREAEDVFQFEHHFPVDVTIPKNRIENLEAIDVNIDSFDYALPEKGYLKLNADLAIYGIRSEEIIAESSQYEEDALTPIYPDSPLFVDENGEDIHTEEDESYNALFVENRSVDFEENEELEPHYNFTCVQNSSDDVEETDTNQVSDLYTPFTVEARKQQDDEVEVPIKINYEDKIDTPTLQYGVEDYEELESETDPTQDYALSRLSKEESSDYYGNETYDESSPMNQLQDDVYEDQDESDAQEQTIKKKKKIGKYESISLADFFARKSEEKAAKLKVCIVQHGESLDLLAEKYDISVQQILRMNHLEMNQDVFEGQVLYIPSYASTTKK